jgi:hypothetical protein
MAEPDTKLSEAMTKVFEKDGGYRVTDKNNKAFKKFVTDLFAAGDAETISNHLTDALKNNNIGGDRLAILVDVARHRSDNLPLTKVRDSAIEQGIQATGFLDTAHSLISQSTSESVAPVVFENTMKRIKQEGAQGEQILNVTNDEIRKQLLKAHPEISKYPKEGIKRADENGNIWRVYPDGRAVEEVK